MELRVHDLRQGYLDIVARVIARGERVAPRGQATREVLGATIVLDNPRDSLPQGIGRKPNVGIAAAEACQLVGGFSDPQLMSAVTRNFDQFRDGGIFHGAYGPRMRPQLGAIVRRLQQDAATRQAVVTLWDPLHDLHVDGVKDYPCTVSLHFMIRDDRVVLHTTMRSNDVWWGLAYDAFQFTQLQLTVAGALGLEAGPYFHHANSLHVYERDLPAIERLHEPTSMHPLPRGFHSTPGVGISSAMARARMIGEGVLPSDPTSSELWYFETLARFVEKAK